MLKQFFDYIDSFPLWVDCLILTGIAVSVIFSYACCVVAGRCDEQAGNK